MSATPYRSAGRRYFPAVIFDMIIERVAKGQDLQSICSDPAMPSRQTVYATLTEDPVLSKRYADAVRTAVERRAAKTTTA